MKFAILGAGSAGQGLASYLSLKGYDINLFNLRAGRLVPIRAKGGIKVSGVVEGFAQISKVTTDISEAIADADVIAITVRAYGHKKLLELCLPYLKDGQLVIFMTGYWASLRLRGLLDDVHCDVVLAETTLLPLVSEVVGPGEVRISGIKSKVKVAAFPSTRTEEVLRLLKDVLPQLVAGKNVLETNLDNFNPIFHAPIALFNLGALERINNFEFYHQGVTLKIAEVIDSIDRERLKLAGELELGLRPGTNSLKQYYGASGESTYEIFKNCKAYKGYILPNVFDYVQEDVPYGLVPIASLCEFLNVPNRATKSIISTWSLVDKIDYWEEGITVRQLGLCDMGTLEIMEFVSTGRK